MLDQFGERIDRGRHRSGCGELGSVFQADIEAGDRVQARRGALLRIGGAADQNTAAGALVADCVGGRLLGIALLLGLGGAFLLLGKDILGLGKFDLLAVFAGFGSPSAVLFLASRLRLGLLGFAREILRPVRYRAALIGRTLERGLRRFAEAIGRFGFSVWRISFSHCWNMVLPRRDGKSQSADY
ncbi:hypothetical protein NIM86_10580 [Notoacmeibacter sp. MSK16QG-6]|nr:hypothetical protein [Notoacmeibacter sp. MSK16QG-6]MCP1199853.1 hypothetical protein [Notoacmeibacter sp. MSK16QG-6]